nr:hypothetical protein [Planctomycetota bacterium]
MTLTTAPTPLATDNPFFAASLLPFQAPPFDRIREEHFEPAMQVGMREHLAEIRAIATQPAAPSFANTIEALERGGALLSRACEAFFHLTGSHTNPTLQKIQATMAPQLAAHSDAIYLDAELFARVQSIYEGRANLTGEQLRLAERYHIAFVRNGARLDATSQTRLRAINSELSQLT